MSGAKSYTLYLDSTGESGWNPPYGKSKNRYYVVAGLALTPKSNLGAYRDAERILKKYIPKQEWSSKKFELCYHHLIRGKGIYGSLTHPQRFAMANEVFDLILSLKPILFATVIDKPALKGRYGINAYDPKLLAIRATIHRFAMSMKRESAVGAVSMDAEEYRKDHLIQEMVRTFKKNGIIIRGFTYQPMYIERINRIVDTINFTDSNVSSGIQLADFCARTTWQHYERNKSKRFQQISLLWDRVGYRIYEPSVFPK
jgi:hypothetical protein